MSDISADDPTTGEVDPLVARFDAHLAQHEKSSVPDDLRAMPQHLLGADRDYAPQSSE